MGTMVRRPALVTAAFALALEAFIKGSAFEAAFAMTFVLAVLALAEAFIAFAKAAIAFALAVLVETFACPCAVCPGLCPSMWAVWQGRRCCH